jgi:hypothetical protein
MAFLRGRCGRRFKISGGTTASHCTNFGHDARLKVLGSQPNRLRFSFSLQRKTRASQGETCTARTAARGSRKLRHRGLLSRGRTCRSNNWDCLHKYRNLKPCSTFHNVMHQFCDERSRVASDIAAPQQICIKTENRRSGFHARGVLPKLLSSSTTDPSSSAADRSFCAAGTPAGIAPRSSRKSSSDYLEPS